MTYKPLRGHRKTGRRGKDGLVVDVEEIGRSAGTWGTVQEQKAWWSRQ